jgi:hypothetical protein
MAGKSFSARASQKHVHQSARTATCANDAGGGTIRVGKFRKVPGSNQALKGASEDFSYKRMPQEVSDLMRNFY